MAFSKDGQRLYTAGADGMICELDVADGQVIQKFKGFKNPLSSVALLPGNSLVFQFFCLSQVSCRMQQVHKDSEEVALLGLCYVVTLVCKISRR